MIFKTCSRCHKTLPISEFYKDPSRSDGYCYWCKSCKKKQKRTYYLENKERIDKRNKEYNRKHSEELKEKNHIWYVKNKDKVLERTREYGKTEKGLEIDRNRKRKLRLIKQNNSITPSQWGKIKEIYNYRCAYCGESFSDTELTMDHIVPLSQGGENMPYNIVPACRSCNSRKGPNKPNVPLQTILVVTV